MLSRSQLLGLSIEAQDCFAVVESLQKFISVALDLVDLTNPLSSLNKVAIVLQVYSGSMDTQLKERDVLPPPNGVPLWWGLLQVAS